MEGLLAHTPVSAQLRERVVPGFCALDASPHLSPCPGWDINLGSLSSELRLLSTLTEQYPQVTCSLQERVTGLWQRGWKEAQPHFPKKQKASLMPGDGDEAFFTLDRSSHLSPSPYPALGLFPSCVLAIRSCPHCPAGDPEVWWLCPAAGSGCAVLPLSLQWGCSESQPKSDL